jgi:hypothetical protein
MPIIPRIAPVLQPNLAKEASGWHLLRKQVTKIIAFGSIN